MTPKRDIEKTDAVIRSLKGLVSINDKPPVDFWNEVDEQLRAKNGDPAWDTPAFKAWMKEVAGMTAEAQAEAVKKKLVELNPGFSGMLKPQSQKARFGGLLSMRGRYQISRLYVRCFTSIKS